MPERKPGGAAGTLLLVALLGAPSSGAGQGPFGPPHEQIRWALTAAPLHLRADATVLVLETDGYRVAREGTNGFHCLVERWERDTVTPICYDRLGAATTLDVVKFLERERARDRPDAEIKEEITDGYESGRFKVPEGVGVAYMLSEESPAPPHVMYYAPYRTNAEFGGAEGAARAAMPFIYDEGSPLAYIVQLVDPEALRRLTGG